MHLLKLSSKVKMKAPIFSKIVINLLVIVLAASISWTSVEVFRRSSTSLWGISLAKSIIDEGSSTSFPKSSGETPGHSPGTCSILIALFVMIATNLLQTWQGIPYSPYCCIYSQKIRKIKKKEMLKLIISLLQTFFYRAKEVLNSRWEE